MGNESQEQYIQQCIGYVFKRRGLLCQAFTRKSYTEENRQALNNEILEFYGDKALDFIVTKKMCEYYGHIENGNLFSSAASEGELTEIRKKLVCRKMLAKRIRTLGLQYSLLMGRGDKEQEIWNQEAVQEDLFEAILGAVAVDSNWNVEALTTVVNLMLDPEYYFENGFNDELDYVALLQQWYQKKYHCLPIYTFMPGWQYRCQLAIYPFDYFYGEGESKSKARMAVAKEAYQYIESKNLLMSFVDVVGTPTPERAINQLQELYQKGYIGEPQYSFLEGHDGDGNPLWLCECFIKGLNVAIAMERHPSKKEGKKMVAYKMMKILISEEKNDT